MKTRIYFVTQNEPQKTVRLVKATSQSAAIRHVVEPSFEAHIAKQDELVELLNNGIKVEE